MKSSETSEIMKRTFGSNVEDGPRAYVAYNAYGFPTEVEKQFRAIADDAFDRMKKIAEESAGQYPAD
jgi:BMFP domain-containing protein YqiC